MLTFFSIDCPVKVEYRLQTLHMVKMPLIITPSIRFGLVFSAVDVDRPNISRGKFARKSIPS